jgi:hypothetical protein
MSSDYSFFNLGRIGADNADLTQRQLMNTRMNTYSLGNYFSEPTKDDHVSFATTYPNMMFGGSGVHGAVIDDHSRLVMGDVEQTRSLEKLSLNTRPFITIPYLGKGSCNPTLESQLLIGESSTQMKSVGTIMSKSFMDHSMYPLDSTQEERVSNAANTIEEVAMEGWVRGGIMSRQMAGDQDHYSQQSRPVPRW